MTKTKTIKIPFDVILRNKRTKEEIKVQELSIPVRLNVEKRVLHNIMKKNVKKENQDGGD